MANFDQFFCALRAKRDVQTYRGGVLRQRDGFAAELLDGLAHVRRVAPAGSGLPNDTVTGYGIALRPFPEELAAASKLKMLPHSRPGARG